jgi:hypothetical protein
MRVNPAPPRLRLVPRQKQWFGYECQTGFFDVRLFLLSLFGHIVVLIFLPAFTPVVTILRAVHKADARDVTLIYAPTLPEIRSSSEPSRARTHGAEGMRQRSRGEIIRTISSNGQPAPVLVQSIAARAPDARKLTSLIPISVSGNVTLAPQPVEIASNTKKDIQPTLVPMKQFKRKMAQLPSNHVVVKLAPQPIEIASERKSSSVASHEPVPLAPDAIPTSSPKLPIVPASVNVREAKYISGGTRALEASTGSAPPSATGIRAIAQQGAGGGIPNGALVVTPGTVVLNPRAGKVIGGAVNQQGRIAADPDGVASGRGLGDSGTGHSNAGDRGNDPGARGVGPQGNGNVSIDTEPGAGSSNSGSSPVAVDGGVIELGSFGPAATGPLHGRAPAIVIVSSAGAGGALQQFASRLHGRIYTVYLNTSGSTGVMQFSETKHPTREQLFSGDLIPPESISTFIPNDLRSVHQVVSCVLTPDGRLKDIKLLIDSGGNAAERFTQALQHWLFRPAYRDDKPVAVDVLLGFSVDTN